MRKVDDGGKKRKKEKKEKNGVFSGHYVIASSLLPERLRPNDFWNATLSCQNKTFTEFGHDYLRGDIYIEIYQALNLIW